MNLHRTNGFASMAKSAKDSSWKRKNNKILPQMEFRLDSKSIDLTIYEIMKMNNLKIGSLDKYIKIFVNGLVSISKSYQFSSRKQLEEVIEACKSRKDLLQKIYVFMFNHKASLDLLSSCSIEYKTLTGFKQYRGKLRRNITISSKSDIPVFNVTSIDDKVPDEISVDSLLYLMTDESSDPNLIDEREPFINNEALIIHMNNPSFYTPLFELMLSICNLCFQSAKIVSSESIKEIDSYVKLMSLIVSLANSYNCILPSQDYIQSKETEIFNNISCNDHQLDFNSNWFNLFNLVKLDIKEGRLRYIKDIAYLYKNRNNYNSYSEMDMFISTASTGTVLKQNKQTIPGLLAASFETDRWINDPVIKEFDNKIGYQSNYITKGAPLNELCDQAFAKCMTIPQHKLKRRLIQMCDNPTQDRLCYIHNILYKNILTKVHADCTDNQYEGVQFLANKTMNFSDSKTGIFCLDINSATDNLDQTFQQMVLKLFLPDFMVDAWEKLMYQDKVMVFDDQSTTKRFIQLCGQPQGFKSSFPSFALVHHIIMRMLMKHYSLEHEDPNNLYRVLGDDSCFVLQQEQTDDQFHKVIDTYIDICQWINWQTNKTKGIITLPSDTSKTGEFAKCLVSQGIDITPVPHRLLLQSSKDFNRSLAVMNWISQHWYNNKLDPINLITTLQPQRRFGEEMLNKTIILANSIFNTEFNCIKKDINNIYYKNIINSSILIAELLAYLLRDSLPDSLKDKGISDDMALNYKHIKFSNFYVSGRNKSIKLIEDLIIRDGDSNSKYFRIIKNNDTKIDIIQDFLLGLNIEFEDSIRLSIFKNLNILHNLRSTLTWTEIDSTISAFIQLMNILIHPESDLWRSNDYTILFESIGRFLPELHYWKLSSKIASTNISAILKVRIFNAILSAHNLSYEQIADEENIDLFSIMDIG